MPKTNDNSTTTANPENGALHRVQRWYYRIEDIVVSALLLFMILFAAAQIFMRNLFDAGISWGDVLVRILVLWVGLFGAMVASRTGEHIKIDLLSRYLKPP